MFHVFKFSEEVDDISSCNLPPRFLYCLLSPLYSISSFLQILFFKRASLLVRGVRRVSLGLQIQTRQSFYIVSARHHWYKIIL